MPAAPTTKNTSLEDTPMPLTPRSLGRLLLPVALSLSPLAAQAASDVTILRDQWGIPQVYADDVYGLFAGFGYAVAEDRLFQMEMARRSVLGTTAEVLGPDQLDYDTTTRANFDPAKIRAQIEALVPRGPRHPDRLRRRLEQAPRRGHGRQGDAPAEAVHRLRLRADAVDRLRRGDDLRRHHGRPLLALSRTS